MGGNALKSTFTRRYGKNEFESLWRRLRPQVELAFNTEAELVISFSEKESFGDMDILIKSYGQPATTDTIHIIDLIKAAFGANEVSANSNVVSFAYEQLQIDLIFTDESIWESSNVFFSYNDLGNLMGKIYHKLGLSYGFDGVKYIKRSGDKILGKFYVCRDPRTTFEFLGLSFDRYLDGFKTIQEVFDYVISSKYFEPESFYYENLDQKNRRRNKKRANYALFIDYINREFRKDTEAHATGTYHWSRDKEKHYPLITEYFKDHVDFMGEIDALAVKEERLLNIRSKFNGELVMSMFPELKGPDLGQFIAAIKERCATDFDEMVYNSNHDDVIKYLIHFYEDYYSK